MRFVLNKVTMVREALSSPWPAPATRWVRCAAICGGCIAATCAAAALTSVPLAAQFAREDPSDARVLLTLEEALEEVFPGHGRVEALTWRPTAEQRARLEATLGRRLYEPRYEILEVWRGGEIMGYGVVTEERGKYRPITFLVGVTPDFHVRDAAVMVYRESRGGEVARRRFLGQYRGKSASDPIRINRDIVNVSGATISVRSVNAGVRKVLAVVEAWASERHATARAASGR
jgi:Na+-translocating ferredoxin:NAD+ oxidoreductase RnfG subunit